MHLCLCYIWTNLSHLFQLKKTKKDPKIQSQRGLYGVEIVATPSQQYRANPTSNGGLGSVHKLTYFINIIFQSIIHVRVISV